MHFLLCGSTGTAAPTHLTQAGRRAGPGPPEILLAAAEDIKRTQKCKSRLCMRFTPVEMVGYAALNEMRRTAAKVVEPYFAGQEQPIKFSVQFDHRASAKLDRLEVINAVIESIKQARCFHPPATAGLLLPKTLALGVLAADSSSLRRACSRRTRWT